METIVFYGNKSSSFLVKQARLLGKQCKKIFIADFNIINPTLHEKLKIGERVVRGLVDYINFFLDKQTVPTQLQKFVVSNIFLQAYSHVDLLPAGNTLSDEYIDKVLNVDWKKLFPIPIDGEKYKRSIIFENLKIRIENDYKPDFLLIDAGNGISDIGIIALEDLADVVCSESKTAVLSRLQRKYPKTKQISAAECFMSG